MLDPAGELVDRGRLVAGRLVVADDAERRNRALEVGHGTGHPPTVRRGPDAYVRDGYRRGVRLLAAAEADRRARAAAAALARRGLGREDRVAVVLPHPASDRLEAAEVQAGVLALVLGSLRSGVVPVMVNPELTATERALVLSDADPGLLVDDPAQLAALTDPEGRCDIEVADVPLGRAMHYTSGTTGTPKGVWTGAQPEVDATRWWGDEQEQWGFAADDTMLVHGPLAHSGPLRFAVSALLAGGAVLLPGRFDAAEVAAAMRDHRPTVAFTVPSHLQRLLALPGGPGPSPYRLLLHAGASCPGPLKRRVHAWAGVDRVWEFYGATEGQFTACSGPEWEQRPGTVGRARQGRGIEVDDDGTIWCTSPAYASFSYWRDPQRTAAAWRDGPGGRAFTVRDLGRLDGDGFLWLDGRRDDLVISGGVNVYPAEVEQTLLECPGVREVAVFGLDDERWGQRVCAAVVGDVAPEAVRRWADERLAPFKRPKDIYPTESLPHTASGKIQRLAVPAALGLPPRLP